MIHLPSYTWPDALRRTFSSLYWLRSALDSIKADGRRFLLRFGLGYPFMFGVKYDSKGLYALLSGMGFRDIEIRFFQSSAEAGRLDFRSYLFARKSPPPGSES